jgi:hypothetical protein
MENIEIEGMHMDDTESDRFNECIRHIIPTVSEIYL